MITIQRRIGLACLLVWGVFAVWAQSEAQTGAELRKSAPFPIFSYGDNTVYSDEFLRVFNKNKKDKIAPTRLEIEEYLDLYIKFKLKVQEAYTRQMDTVPSFIRELSGYRSQLAQPYLTDKTVTDRLVRQAYDRSQQEVKASHLLIKCGLDAKPQDTLAAYQKIMGLRQRIVKGADFSELATKHSEDESAKVNNGNLGYFTAFQMIYPFENAAFNHKVGEVSMPARTQFGYHLVYVEDKRKVLGDILVSHIMLKYYNEAQVDSVKQRIDAVYTKLQEGADWASTVEEFSEDFNTNSKGGKLSWFNRTTSNIPVEFKNTAYELSENGSYSKPVKTKFGWHIIRREDYKAAQSFEESKDRLRRKVERDSRSELNKEIVIARVKEENHYRGIGGLSAVASQFDEDLLTGNYREKLGDSIELFAINGKKYLDKDFYRYVAANQTKTQKTLDKALQDYYDDFVNQSNLEYEESILEEKYDDFKYIMQEYKDGILLFELTDQEVWGKAVEDTLGLESFYNENQANYMWKERAEAIVYSCKDEKSAKKASKAVRKGVPTAEILEKCNAKDPLTVKVDMDKFEKGKNEQLNQVEWAPGVYEIAADNDREKFVHIKEILPPSPKKLEDNLGQITSDYQNHLESLWIASLKKKYPVKVFEDNVQKLYK